MRKLYLMLIPATCLMISSCSKSVSDEQTNAAQQKADEFTASIKSHKYKPVAFYSDKPIDYITNDAEVKAETDLWAYVRDHIRDDENLFGDKGSLTIYQRNIKISGNDAATINGNYSATAKNADVMFNFVDYNYSAFEYKLEQFDNAFFVVYVDGPNGSKLYSKFARVE